MGRKGQIQIGENVVIIFVFILLVVGALIFYSRIQVSEFNIRSDENADKEFIAISQKASFLPELRCSNENVPVENCFDRSKLEKFISLADENYMYYQDEFKASSITLEKIFPLPRQEWVLYDNPQGNDEAIPAFIPVSIYDPAPENGTVGVYYMGILTVQVWR